MPYEKAPTILINGKKIESESSKAANLNKLRSSIEEKREILNKMYEDNTIVKKETSHPLNPLDTNQKKNSILKHVQFDTSDEEDSHKFKSTYKIQKPNTTKENSKKTPTTQKSPAKPRVPTLTKPYLTVQQKRELAAANKAKFLKEINILHKKVLARKFGYIWLRKCINSSSKNVILPSQATKYHEDRKKRLFITRWYSETCWTRNEWRLTVKAQCHHNYVIRNKFWDYWKEYTTESKEENKLMSRAVSYNDFKLKSLFYKQWKDFTFQIIRKKINLLAVQKQRSEEILKYYLEIWKEKLKKNKNMSKLNEIADQHFNIVQLDKYYSFWYLKFKTEKEDRNANRLAIKHYKETLQHKCFQSLQYYTMYRKKKVIQKKKIDEYAESQLVYKVYHMWLKRYELKQRENQINVRIEIFRERFLAAKVLDRWKNAFNSKIDTETKEIKALKHYNKKLKKIAFNGLKSNYLEEENRKKNDLRAELFFKYWTKQRYLFKWQEKYDDKTDIRSLHLMCRARLHHEKSIVKSCYQEWKISNNQAILLKALNAKANNFRKQQQQKTFFKEIQLYVQITKTKRDNYHRAIEMSNQNTFYSYFYKWMQKYELTIELQMNTRIAILHKESKLKEITMKIWTDKLQEKIVEECQNNRADIHYKKMIVKRQFKRWKETLNESKCELMKENLAILYDYRRICLPVFLIWKKYIEQTRHYNIKLINAESYYQRNILKKTFNSWQHCTKEFKEINFQIECKYQAKKLEQTHSMLNKLRQNAIENKRNKHNEELAQSFHLKHLMKGIILEWNAYSTNKALKRYEQLQQIESFNSIRNKLIIRDIYAKWLQKTKINTSTEAKLNESIDFYKRKIKIKAFSVWCEFTKECRYNRLLDNQAKYFLEMRLKTEFYYKWLNAYGREVELRDKNQNALMFWSINIQRKCLQSWITWIKIKREKKDRYKKSLEKRQIDILKICGRNFIQYSTDSKLRRQDSTRLLKEKNLLCTLDLQAKYVKIWLEKCTFFKKNQNIQSESLLPPESVIHLPVFIKESNSLEHKEATTGILSDLGQKSRPAPRKPSFLIDSIDNSNSPTSIKIEIAEPIPQPITITKTVTFYESTEVLNKSIESEDISVKKKPKSSPILLPPSAFTNITKSPEPLSQTTSMSCLSNRENSPGNSTKESCFKLNLKNCASTSSFCQEPKKTRNDFDLMNFKKRLENLSIKAENLKRLKEQERLLDKIIETNEANKTLSFCGTIYDEKDQVTVEIDHLTKYLKVEKQKINELAKKYRL